MNLRLIFFPMLFLLIFSANSFAQNPAPTPPEEKPEKIITEEIKLNVSALDRAGRFVSDLKKEDLVINEDGRLNQATSVRRIPANVLILLDVGNEISYAKRSRTTVDAAKSLIASLRENDSFAVMQFGDKTEVLFDWIQNKTEVRDSLRKKIGFGRRSNFFAALDFAIDYFQKTKRENRHLVLITNGIDSFNNPLVKFSAIGKLYSSEISVHVISYTAMQRAAIAAQTKNLVEGDPKPKRLPEEVIIALPPEQQRIARMPRLGGINLDREMMRKRKEELNKIDASEKFLSEISEDANGEIFLPVDAEEMSVNTETLARSIDSQYVVTFIPKSPLSESPPNETRVIEVSSRRAGLEVRGRRILRVLPNQ